MSYEIAQTISSIARVSKQPEAPHLQKLNPPQLSAVRHHLGPILVLAGAGSGKTRVLTRRIVNLVLEHKVAPHQILAVTFTNKATDEMRQRLAENLGPRADQLWVATFHSAALRILRRHAATLGYKEDFVVYDDQDTKGVLKSIIKDLELDEKKHPPSEFSRIIDDAKNNFIDDVTYAKRAETPNERRNAEVYSSYQKILRSSNAMDFGDLLLNAALLLRDNAGVRDLYQQMIRFVLVDEFQDTNCVQYELIKLLTAKHRNLLVVGDDDQSIYAFRGATVKNILDFERDFPDTAVIKLEQNYRSSGNILAAAQAIIEKNSARKNKKLWTASDSGQPVKLFLAQTESDEAAFVIDQIDQGLQEGRSLNDFAIFYRTNAQSRVLEEYLISAGLNYRIYGALKFYERKEIKDVVAYLRLIANDADSQAFQRIVNTPPRGIGAQTLQSVATLATRESVSMMDAARIVAERHKGMAHFIDLLDGLRSSAATLPLGELIKLIVERSGYATALKASKDVQSQSRIENLKELEAIGRSMERLEPDPARRLQSFLDRVSLTSSGDIQDNERVNSPSDKFNQPAVSLMTLHIAKGLEFPVVFLTGLEDGLIPHYRSIERVEDIEEERRLCYVGITRAKESLYISRAAVRSMFSSGGGSGAGMYRVVSRFAHDLPPTAIESLNSDPREDFFEQSKYQFSGEDLQHDEDFVKPPKLPKPREIIIRRNGAQRRIVEDGRSIESGAGEIRLASADSLAERGVPAADLERFVVGARVLHPHHGVGTIAGVTPGPRGAPDDLRLTIKFEKYARDMKLVARYAELKLA